MVEKATKSVTNGETLLWVEVAGSGSSAGGASSERAADARAATLVAVGECVKQGGGRTMGVADGRVRSVLDAPCEAARCALAIVQTCAEANPGDSPTVRIAVHAGNGASPPSDSPSTPPPAPSPEQVAECLLSIAMPGQILMTGAAFSAARQELAAAPDGSPLEWLAHGAYLFAGIDVPVDIFEVRIEGTPATERPAGLATAQRSVAAQDEITLGWRPAKGLPVPRDPAWRLERKLGEGGFGEVWLAVHETTRKPMAFKFCFNAARLRTLKREITLFRLLREALGDRPDIARLHDVQLEQPPYYLKLEYTAGGDLVAWAKARGGIESLSLEGRLELVAQVAEALSAAHSVGILHKDIKPANVMVEEKGDGTIRPKLTDFGVGQLIERGRLLDLGIHGSGFSTHPSTFMTDVSSRSGTRLYMAPELFAGKEPSIQSDVYALGVMLYQVVVGDLSRPLGQGWERDIDDELVREDIAACVDGDPDRRLTSAGELAKRLRTLEERRSERDAQHRAKADVARHRQRQRVFLVTAACAVVIAVFIGFFAWRESRLRRQAERAELEAEKARADAEGLVEFMLTDLHDELEPIGRLEILSDVVEEVLAYYAGVDTEGQSMQALRNRARALNNIARIQVSQGQPGQALISIDQAIAISLGLLAQDPSNPAVLGDHAEFLASKGYALVKRMDFPEATRTIRHAVEIRERLLEAFPDDPSRRYDLADSLCDLGYALRLSGADKEAREVAQKGQMIAEELHHEDPEENEWLRVMARTSHEIALGDPTRTSPRNVEQMMEVLRVAERLVELDPNNSKYRYDLGRTHNNLGVSLTIWEEQLKHYRAALEIWLGLAEQDPTNATWRRALVTAYRNLAWALWKVGDREGSLEASREAKRICKELMKIDPNNTEWFNVLMGQLNIIVHNLQVLGRKEEAVEIGRERAEVFKEQVVILRNKVNRAPASTEALDNLTRERNQLISNLVEVEESDEVLKVLQEAIEEGRQNIANNPASMAWQRYLAVALRDMGDQLNKMDRDDEADKVYNESAASCRELVALARELMNQNPESEEVLQQHTEAQFLLIGILEETGDDDKLQALITEVIDDARKCLTEGPNDHKWLIIRAKWLQWFSHQVMGISLQDATESVEVSMILAKSAVEQMPDDLEYLKTLGETQYDLVGWQSRLGRHEESLEASRSWARTLTRIADLDPENHKELGVMSLRLFQVGRNWERLGHKNDARGIWERAVLIVEPVTAGPDRSSVLSEHLDLHAQVLLRLKRVDEARPLVDELLKRGWEDEEFLIDCLEHGLLPWQSDPEAYRDQRLGEVRGPSSATITVNLPPLQPLADALQEHWARVKAGTKGAIPQVRVRGVVTASPLRLLNRGQFYIQEGQRGIHIDDASLRGVINQTLKVGMHVELVGRIVDYRGMPELKPDQPVLVLGTRDVPQPLRLNASDFNTSQLSTLVDVGRVKILNPEGSKSNYAYQYNAVDANGTKFWIRVEAAAGVRKRFFGPDNTCHLRGILTVFNGQYGILPRSIADLQ